MGLHLGDCLGVLPGLPADSIDSIVTDPPYGLSFMGKNWDHGVPGTAFWVECLRVAKPGAHLLAFGGTRTYHRLVVAIEDAGFEIRDQIGWAYGSGFPKSMDPHKKDARCPEGLGTALKPAWEPICVARKPLTGTVAENVLAHGTGALNIDACRVATTDDLNGGAYAVEGGRSVSHSLRQGSGMNQPGKTVGKEFVQPVGRWPANVIHDGSPEVLALFPDSKGQQGFVGERHGDRSAINCYGDWGPRPDTPPRGDTGSAARFFYCAKASKADRDEGLEGFLAQPSAAADFRPNHAEKAARGENGNPYGRWQPRKNNHPTVKPTDLMRYLCRLITPEAGRVLDPFMGSGSTGKAAVLDGFGFVGIEKEAEYFALASARVEWAKRERARQLAMGIQIPMFEVLDA